MHLIYIPGNVDENRELSNTLQAICERSDGIQFVENRTSFGVYTTDDRFESATLTPGELKTFVSYIYELQPYPAHRIDQLAPKLDNDAFRHTLAPIFNWLSETRRRGCQSRTDRIASRGLALNIEQRRIIACPSISLNAILAGGGIKWLEQEISDLAYFLNMSILVTSCTYQSAVTKSIRDHAASKHITYNDFPRDYHTHARTCQRPRIDTVCLKHPDSRTIAWDKLRYDLIIVEDADFFSMSRPSEFQPNILRNILDRNTNTPVAFVSRNEMITYKTLESLKINNDYDVESIPVTHECPDDPQGVKMRMLMTIIPTSIECAMALDKHLSHPQNVSRAVKPIYMGCDIKWADGTPPRTGIYDGQHQACRECNIEFECGLVYEHNRDIFCTECADRLDLLNETRFMFIRGGIDMPGEGEIPPVVQTKHRFPHVQRTILNGDLVHDTENQTIVICRSKDHENVYANMFCRISHIHCISFVELLCGHKWDLVSRIVFPSPPTRKMMEMLKKSIDHHIFTRPKNPIDVYIFCLPIYYELNWHLH